MRKYKEEAVEEKVFSFFKMIKPTVELPGEKQAVFFHEIPRHQLSLPRVFKKSNKETASVRVR